MSITRAAEASRPSVIRDSVIARLDELRTEKREALRNSDTTQRIVDVAIALRESDEDDFNEKDFDTSDLDDEDFGEDDFDFDVDDADFMPQDHDFGAVIDDPAIDVVDIDWEALESEFMGDTK